MTTPHDADTVRAKDLVFPAMLCAATFFIALTLAIVLGLSGTAILATYWLGSLYPAVLLLMIWSVFPSGQGAEYRACGPLKAIRMLLAKRWPLLLFPLLLTPIFNTGYTVAKTAFPHFVGFGWDGYWTQVDRTMFGVDPWRITHALFGPLASEWLARIYTIGWGLALLLVLPATILWAKARTALRVHLSFMLTWFFGGVVGATLFSSAGPIFAILSDPALADYFMPLDIALGQVLPDTSIILRTQAYLQGSIGTGAITNGTGISAMPSMHLATAALYVLLAQRTKFFIPAIIFWLIMWIGSVHLGYHYAVDGIGGALVAWAAWRVTAARPACATAERSLQLAVA